MSKGFGLVQPSLIQQIKKILDQYPDDGQILKELIQNAEDAGAREVKFLYDHHSYGTKKLHHSELKNFQGPALYSYNDARFTEKDWYGIGMLCESIKEKDPTKVGRFGLGFKSVFHMTDLPSVISGDSVGIIDPEETYFSDDKGKRSGQKWHLKNDRRIISEISDQFAPYKGIHFLGCHNDKSFERGDYEGTLFRLPLRQESSPLSETLYSTEKIRSLLKCFEKDAHLILLFLMNLERIEVYEREAHCSHPRKLFHVGISDHCLSDVRKAREEFNTKVKENVSALSSGSFPEVKKTYPLTIETVQYNNGVSSKTEHSFVVTLYFCGSNISQDIKALMTDESLSYLPLVGVALPLQPQVKQEDAKGGVEMNYELYNYDDYDDYNEYQDDRDDYDDYNDYQDDRNDYDDYNDYQDERDDYDDYNDYQDDRNDYDDYNDYQDDRDDYDDYNDYQDERDDYDDYNDYVDVHGMSCRENKNIARDAEPQGHLFCFLPLPLESKSLTGLPVHVNGFFALSQNRRHLKWPSADQDETLTDKSLLWNKGLLQEVLPKAYAELILHVISCLSEDEQRQMMATSDAYNAWPDINKVDVKWKGILQPLFDILLQSEVLYTDANGGRWCKVEEVVLDRQEENDQSRETVIELLNKTGQKVVTVPAHVETALQQFRTMRYVTPEILRTSLKTHPSCYSNLSRQDKILLLKFVLSDSDFTELEGLELLPLSDKTFTKFRRQSDDPIYIDSAEHSGKSLLPGLQRMFLDTELDDAVTEQLKKAVEEGHTQVRHFNVEAVKRHLRQTLPSDWLDSEDHVTWYPGRSNHPTIDWLKALWEYFAIHFCHMDSLLDAFIGLPLVPVTPMSNRNTEVQLARIQRPSSLVLASFNGESIDEPVCHVLKALGLTILKDQFIQYYPGLVQLRSSLASPPTPRGVLKALSVFLARHGNKNDLISRKMRGIADDDIRSFRRFLSSVSSRMELDLNVLQILPLFETISGSGGKESQFVSLQMVKIGVANDGLPPVSIFTELLDLKDHSSHVLADLLNVKRMSHNDILKMMLDDALNKKYDQRELDILIKYILDRFGTFHGEDFKSITEKLQRLPFVLSSGNSRKKPNELFDPEDDLLKQVFYGEDVFPEEKSYYSQPDVVSHLMKLGLKRARFVTASDVLRSARLLLITNPIRVDRAKMKFQAILKLLERNPSLLEEKAKPGKTTLKSCLDSIPWIPVLEENPETYPTHLPLKKIANGYFACPKDVISHEFANLAGSVKLLVDTRDLSRVSECFGWDKKPILQDVIGHLDKVIKTFEESSDLDRLNTTQVLEKIYDYFQRIALTENARHEVKKHLSPLDFILVQNQLFSAKKLAFSSKVIYPPYLNQLPDRYKRCFGELFKTVGVRVSFEIPDYIETLKMVKDKYGEKPVTEELAQVISVLNLLAELMGKEGVTAKDAISKYGSIFIPDSDEIMKPSESVCVKDCYWMPSEPDASYINEGVSPQVCIKVGAKTIRQHTLRKHVIPLGIPFGQKEKLTNRLKRILTGYPCDESIMKELLQNADDAKATKVCFIKDPRQHSDERVFEECWKPLQGPALCVYNNAPFTKSDIEGIQNLGEGSKGDDPNKTGQYGVGFNAVYHLTDAPTFISEGEEIGEVMCVFDPNLNFVPDADASNPGMMCNDLPALRENFPDVFSCYEHGKSFPLKNATMFRLPIRNKEMVRTSKISNKVMTTQKLEGLLDDFKKELLQVLLFVNNVNEVSICEIDEETGKLRESCRVQSSLSAKDEKKRVDFSTYVNEVGECLRKRKILVTEIPLKKVSYVLELKDSRGLKQKWFVVRQIGFENQEAIPGSIEEAFERGDLGLLPRGGVASLISSSDDHQDTMGKAFCFLPLPFKTGLPVHINGHFALNHEDRRSLWRDDKGDYRGEWNDTLLRQVVAPCYVTLLDEVRKHISLPTLAGKTRIILLGDQDKGKRVLSKYIKLFPGMETQERYWQILCKEVYHLMNAKALRLLPVLRPEAKGIQTIEWLPPTSKAGRNQPFFDNLIEVFAGQDKKRERRNVTQEREELLRNTLLDVGFNLLWMPINVYDIFISSGVSVRLISPTDVISFFQTYGTKEQLCNVGCLPAHIRDTKFKNTGSLLEIVKYCKHENTFLQEIEGLPLLLTEANVLGVFSQSDKVFLSRYYKLLPHLQRLFVHHDFISILHCDVPLPVFETFDIKAFARLLPNEMDKAQYENARTWIDWSPEEKEDDEILSKRWVREVWKFFSCHIDKVVASYEEQRSPKASYSQMAYSKRKQREEEIEKQDKEAKKRLIKEALDPVKNWCLLPASRAYPSGRFSFDDVEHILVPIAMADTVIDPQSSKGFSSINEALKKMVLPQLNCRLIENGHLPEASKTSRQLVANLEEPQSILTLLTRRLNFDFTPSEFQALEEKDCIIVLRYFNDHITQLEPSSPRELKRLPLYATIHGAIISIHGKKAYVLSTRIPKDDMDIWEETAGIVFLKRSVDLERLYEFLDCHYEDEVDVYCDVIFKNFEEMSEEARMKHLEFVRELMEKLENTPLYLTKETIEENERKLSKITSALSKMKFITTKDGILKQASLFYDPSNDVFRTMFKEKQDMFPPEPFCDWKWLHVLRRIGLIHKVTDKEFLNFAKEVETEARTSLDDETRKKSKALVTHLLESENITSRKLLDDVKSICFIFPYAVHHRLQAIHEQYGSGKAGSPCIFFQGSVASKYQLITWTTANLLPDCANPVHCTNVYLTKQKEKETIARRLDILQNPTVDMVVNHCKNISSVLCQMKFTENSTLKESKRVVEIMTDIYDYLEGNYDENEEVINELMTTRCIVVDKGTRFVFPNQVAVDMMSDQEIPPYLYKVPPEVAAFAELFRKLGTTNTVTAAQYSMVLENIHDETRDEPLHPNEKKSVFKAAKGFFETYDCDKDHESEITPLYLPGVKQNPSDHSIKMVVLETSTEMVYNDAPHLKERIRQFNHLVLVKLADCGLQVSNEDLLVKKLPESIRPLMLTSVVHETLIEGDQDVSCSSAAQELRQVLTSSQFCLGMIRLIKHADYKSEKETSTDTPAFVQERLRCIRVYSVPNLRTKLVYNGRGIPGSEADVSCFEEETQEDGKKVWKIYVEEGAELSNYVSLVAEIIDRITGHLLKTMLVHLPMLLSSKPYKIKERLDAVNIREDNSVREIEPTFLPTPGNFIHINDHHLLVDDFTVFRPGEYVGYELDDPSLRGEDGTPTYIYAIVVEGVLEDGQPTNTEVSLTKYKIDTGKDKGLIVVDASSLYKFCRLSQGNSECMYFTSSRDVRRGSFDEIRKDIRKLLVEAWVLPEEKRNKIIKRLFLKWHPKKNPAGDEGFCAEILKFIQAEIKRFKEEVETEDFDSKCLHVWENRAQWHNHQSSFFCGGGGFGGGFGGKSNPQPGEARRWYKQAKADLEAAINDVPHKGTSYEWACFKCHQSAEKALKAAQYSIDADNTKAVHDLRMIAQELNNHNLRRLASELESLVGDSTRMRYPDRLCYPNIPHTVYSGPIAFKAIGIASDIVQEVESKFIK